MKYFIKKIITLIITLLFISLLTFTAFSVIPGDAAISKLGVDASPEAIARVRAEYELDQPVLTRYVHWLGKALHGFWSIIQIRYNDSDTASAVSTAGHNSAGCDVVYHYHCCITASGHAVSTLCRQMVGCSDQSGDADHNGDSVFLSGNYPDGYFWSGA